MNYLSHLYLARTMAPRASPWFYTGNLLPDLISTSGKRLRHRDMAAITPQTAEETALWQGMQLHFAADQRFHSHPEFKAACAEASRLLLAAPFTLTLRRVFFLAHILVEIALDGRLLLRQPALADDLYGYLQACGPAEIAATAGHLLGNREEVATMEQSIRGFALARFLTDYATIAGQADAVARVCHRVGLPHFAEPGEKEVLIGVVEAFSRTLAPREGELLEPPVGIFPNTGTVVQ